MHVRYRGMVEGAHLLPTKKRSLKPAYGYRDFVKDAIEATIQKSYRGRRIDHE